MVESSLKKSRSLALLLSEWHHDVTDRSSLSRKLLNQLRGSKFAVSASLALVSVVTFDFFKTANTSSLTIIFGAYSSIFAELLLWKRWKHLGMCLSTLSDIVGAVEDNVNPDLWALGRNRARAHRLRRSLYLAFGWLTVVSILRMDVLVPPVWARSMAGNLARASGLDEDVCFSLVHVTKTVLDVVGSLCCLTAFYTFVPCVLLMYSACAFAHKAVGERLMGSGSVVQAVELQNAVLKITIAIDSVITDLLPHVLVATVFMPLITTSQMVVSGDFNPFDFVGGVPILSVFVPLFEAGDDLAASRLQVAELAGFGPWLERSPRQRGLVVGAMRCAAGVGGLPRFRGFGSINRHACLQALKSWFSFLQMLLNLRKID
ncbi:uncharacterized protein LOC127749997 isoform X2 [Frankliniella occidentalis]|nr:uncharacterized protein LOC127749997 isoform X2 [Frankliniella occidentalis]XP_052126317.1 uncharacterized protein LOC127749997 isoform X2 [Frankliniella occidentalis]